MMDQKSLRGAGTTGAPYTTNMAYLSHMRRLASRSRSNVDRSAKVRGNVGLFPLRYDWMICLGCKSLMLVIGWGDWAISYGSDVSVVPVVCVDFLCQILNA